MTIYTKEVLAQRLDSIKIYSNIDVPYSKPSR